MHKVYIEFCNSLFSIFLVNYDCAYMCVTVCNYPSSRIIFETLLAVLLSIYLFYLSSVFQALTRFHQPHHLRDMSVVSHEPPWPVSQSRRAPRRSRDVVIFLRFPGGQPSVPSTYTLKIFVTFRRLSPLSWKWKSSIIISLLLVKETQDRKSNGMGWDTRAIRP